MLSFDDGYAEHFRDVVPLLRDAQLTAVFFPAAWSLIDRRVLDVNKIQFVLAAAETPDSLVNAIDRAVERAAGREDVRPLAEYQG